ncbi:Iron-regulated ABC transporter permease protein SufD [bacterium A37T11]|nr:Iron-regulated ABC transporter permease protein SufD [bacterium A37T11]
MITQLTTSLYNQLVMAAPDCLQPGQEPKTFTDIRSQSFRKFKQLGFPTMKLEDWKYINLQGLVNQSYSLEDSLPGRPVAHERAHIPGLASYHLVMVNGAFRPDLSDSIEDSGITVMPMAEALDELLFAKHFAAYADKTDNPFVALNTALFQNGLFISFDKGSVAAKAIHIIHVVAGSESLFSQTRNLIVMGPNSSADIVETFITEQGAGKSLNNLVSEVVLEESARMQHYILQTASSQSSYLTHTEIHQSKYSLYNNYNCTFPGASFVRNNINVRLAEADVEGHLYGITLTADDQLVDNHTIVDHLKPHCESYEWYKNIVQDASTAVFNGKIFVREDAQKTNAFQQNNNMLIGDKSTVYSKPQLEIFADDVKCSHGCTIGQFNEQSLFYLRARGIGEEQARILLVHAFAFDVTSRFSNEAVKNYVERLVEEGL